MTAIVLRDAIRADLKALPRSMAVYLCLGLLGGFTLTAAEIFTNPRERSAPPSLQSSPPTTLPAAQPAVPADAASVPVADINRHEIERSLQEADKLANSGTSAQKNAEQSEAPVLASAGGTPSQTAEPVFPPDGAPTLADGSGAPAQTSSPTTPLFLTLYSAEAWITPEKFADPAMLSLTTAGSSPRR